MVQKEPARRGRPRSFDPDQALALAGETFWEAGFAAASLDELGAATGLSRPSLYAAFGDKRALYLKALAAHGAANRAALTAALARPGDLRATLADVFRRATELYLAGEHSPRGCFLIATGVPQAKVDAEARTILREALASLDAAFLARFEQAAADGDLPPGADLDGRARLASASLHMLSIRARAGEPRASLDAFAGQATALLSAA